MFAKFISSVVLGVFFFNTAFAEMNLNDLGFKQEDLKIDSKLSQTLEIRHQKLQTHQKLGMVTMGLMTATLLASDEAKKNNLHKYLGITTGLLYWTTAYYSLSAPEIDGQKESGSSKIHQTLAFIHAPLMAIVPVLGYLAKEDANKHKKSTGLVEKHGDLATVAYASFMAAGLTMLLDLSF